MEKEAKKEAAREAARQAVAATKMQAAARCRQAVVRFNAMRNAAIIIQFCACRMIDKYREERKNSMAFCAQDDEDKNAEAKAEMQREAAISVVKIALGRAMKHIVLGEALRPAPPSTPSLSGREDSEDEDGSDGATYRQQLRSAPPIERQQQLLET